MYYSTYIFVIIGALLTITADIYVKLVYRKYSKVPVLSGYTGQDTANIILRSHRVKDISVLPMDEIHPRPCAPVGAMDVVLFQLS